MFEINLDQVTLYIKRKRPCPAGFRFESMNPALAILPQDAFTVFFGPQSPVPGEFKLIRLNPGCSQASITGGRDRGVSVIAAVTTTVQTYGFST